MGNLIAKNESREVPFFTIAIPHYRHKEHLKIAIDSILCQEFSDYEILISDNFSPCDAINSIPDYLQSSGVCFKYFRQLENIGYDANVRFCILNSSGRYIFLLGNDDCLTEASTLKKIHENLSVLNFPSVAFTSYADYITNKITWRGQSTKILGYGPAAALKVFRCFSFVSGLIFEGSLAKKYNIKKWDGSIYYQFYLGCKIISEGYKVGSIRDSAVYINTTVNGKKVDTACKRSIKFSFAKRNGGFLSIICVVIDTICPYFSNLQKSSVAKKIIIEIYSISYGHGLIHYRVNYGWSYAVGVARMMRPGIIFSEIGVDKVKYGSNIFSINKFDRIKLLALYIIISIIGLLIPVKLYNICSPRLGKLVRKIQQR
jgi:glycosyltransferase involved in cell wall biosynthesis